MLTGPQETEVSQSCTVGLREASAPCISLVELCTVNWENYFVILKLVLK